MEFEKKKEVKILVIDDLEVNVIILEEIIQNMGYEALTATSVKEALYEPVGMWLPANLREGGSEYVQGVELPMDYNKTIPEGFELVELPACTMMVFQGEPYNDEEFEEAIGEVWEHIQKFNPEIYGYEWAPESAPRFQLAPMGYRGYIEARPIRKK